MTEAAGRTYATERPYPVGRAKIAEFADALGDANPAYHDTAAARAFGHPDVVAPPTFGIVVVFGLLERMLADPELGLALPRILHADQRFVLIRPLRAGDELSACLTVERTRRMGGADLLLTRTDLVAAGSEPVGEVYATVLHQPADGDGAVRETASGADADGPADEGALGVLADAGVPCYDQLTVGQELPSLAATLRRVDLVRYAGASGDVNPIHWNDRTARSVGLPGVVAHGMLTMAQAARVVTDWVGDPGRVREYAVRFTKPVLVPDDDIGAGLRVTGRIAELRPDRSVRLDLTATVGGEAVLGRARAVVQLP